MKINFVSFSDYSGEVEVYNLEKMDLFVFLLVKIIQKGSDKTIKDVLLDMDITNALLYLYQNNFYYLLDNGYDIFLHENGLDFQIKEGHVVATDKEIRKAHNIEKIWIGGGFSGFFYGE